MHYYIQGYLLPLLFGLALFTILDFCSDSLSELVLIIIDLSLDEFRVIISQLLTMAESNPFSPRWRMCVNITSLRLRAFNSNNFLPS